MKCYSLKGVPYEEICFESFNVALSVVLVCGLLPVSAGAETITSTTESTNAVTAVETQGQATETSTATDVPTLSATTTTLETQSALQTLSVEEYYAVLYSDGTLAFQGDPSAAEGKSALYTYRMESSKSYDTYTYESIPWHGLTESVVSVSFDVAIAPSSTSYWFFGMNNLKSISGIENLNTSNVTLMDYMFSGCLGLTSLDLSNFDTSKVTDMSGMFSGCSGLTYLDLSSFETSSLISGSYMFSCCSVSRLTISTKTTIIAVGAFAGCSTLTDVYYSGSEDDRAAMDIRMINYNLTNATWHYKHVHSLYEKVVSDPTCTKAGYSTLICSYGEEYNRVAAVSALGHDYVTTIVEPTCTAAGYDLHACAFCEESYRDNETAPLGHTFTESGCSRCGVGDVNGNGAMNIVDAQIAYDMATTLIYKERPDYDELYKKANINGDDAVDAADASAIQYAVLRH